MRPLVFWMLAASIVCALGSDEDFIDTENESEAALKCDACRAVSFKLAQYLMEAQGELKMSTALKDEDIVDAVESTCDDAWEGYGVTELSSGGERLVGPGTDIVPESKVEEDPIWPRRLQDLCDELLGEAPEEKTLYNIWASGSSLEEYLCKGEGIFGACSVENWGPWPGDDYDDYDDGSDFDYIHDEF